jgi:trk system potassium uptake protein TrkH
LNVQLDLKILGWLLVGVGAVQIAPLVAALASREPALPFVASALAAIVFGLSIGLAAKPAEPSMRLRDGFLVVAFSWILASTLGALPYLLTGTLEPVDALFESIAGFTTTGSTVMRDIEAAPRGLLLWRSLTQWLGGMGIIVFAIAIVPMLGIGGMQLFKAEMPGVGLDKLRPRIVETARRLLFIYLAFTGIAFLVYALLGMSLFEALCHALTTFSTGGFSTRNASFAAFASPALEWAAIFFMLLAGINFTLHYRLLSGQVRTVAAHSELRYFLGLVFGASLLVAWFVAGSDWPDLTTLRSALFQVVSITTTTGYGSADYETWPVVTSLILLALMTMGGMAGSTAGGVKGLRVLLLRRGPAGRSHRRGRGLRPGDGDLGRADLTVQRGAGLRSRGPYRSLRAPALEREADPLRVHDRRPPRALHGPGLVPAQLLAGVGDVPSSAACIRVRASTRIGRAVAKLRRTKPSPGSPKLRPSESARRARSRKKS